MSDHEDSDSSGDEDYAPSGNCNFLQTRKSNNFDNVAHAGKGDNLASKHNH